MKIENCKIAKLLLLSSLFLLTASVAHGAMVVNSSGVSNNLTSGLVGWWTFDGGDTVKGTPNRILDRTANNYTGTTTDSSFVGGKIGQGLLFNGSNDKVAFGNVLSSDNTSPLSASFWVKRRVSGGVQTIINKAGTESTQRGWLVTWNADKMEFWLNNTLVGNNYLMVQQTTADTDAKWAHFVVTYDGSSSGSGVRIYKNGTQIPVTIVVNTLSATSINSVPFMLGLRDSGAQPLNGILDDVRIYSRALSANEVYSLYQYGNAKVNVNAQAVANQGTTNGLVGYWTFNGGDMTATTAFDKAGTNQGTLVGTKKVSGKVGQGLSFNGTSDYVDESTAATAYKAYTTGTVSAWLKPNTTASQAAFCLGSGTDPSGDNFWCIFYGGITSKKYGVFVRNNTAWTMYGEIPAVDPGQWHHIVATDDTSGNAIYLDGVKQTVDYRVGDGPTTDAWFDDGGNVTHPITKVTTGTRWYNGSKTAYWNGQIDDLRVYSRALSANEVYSLYQYGNAKINVNAQAVAGQSKASSLYYTLDLNGNNSPTATTFLAYNGNGTATTTATSVGGVKKVAGKIGQALSFNGTTGYVDMGNTATALGRSPYTISVWAKTNNPAATQAIIGRGDKSTAAREYLFGFYNGGVFLNRTQGTATELDVAYTFTKNKWYHLVGQYDGSNLYIYINGVKSTPLASTQTVTAPLVTTLGVAWQSASPANYWLNGAVDDVRIYNRALTDNEVYSLYMYGK